MAILRRESRCDQRASAVFGSYASLSAARWPDLPLGIRRRLALERVRNVSDWLALGRRRHQLFGITPRVVAQLDELARGAP
jgi:hypothetical protein